MLNHPEIFKYRGLPISSADVSVAFHDTDAMGTVWHGNYIKYFEIARCAVLQAIDYDFPQMKTSGYAWPIVDMHARYIRPVAYGDKLEAVAVITEWEIRLLIKYLLINKAGQKVVARGQSTQVPVDTKTMTMIFGCPDLLRKKIAHWKEAGNPEQ